MLRVTIELVPYGTGPARPIAVAVIGQVARGVGDTRTYAAGLWDDWADAPAVATVDHQRSDGVWALVGAVTTTRATEAAEQLDSSTLGWLERHLTAAVTAATRPPAGVQPTELEETMEDRLAQAWSEVYAAALPVTVAAELLDTTPGEVERLLQAGDLVAVDGPDGPRLPGWQIHDGARLAGVARVAAAHPGRVLPLSLWAITPNQALGVRTPAQALAEGDVDRVVAIAAAGL